MRNILITIKKELRSIFRDKKTLRAMFIYPILIPCMVILYGNIGDSVDNEEASSTIGVNYEITTEEKELFKEFNLEVIEYKSEAEMNDAYKDKTISAYLTKKDNIYKIYADESSTDGMNAEGQIAAYLDSYNNLLASKFIASKGIDPETAFHQLSYEFESLERNNYMVTVLLAVSLTYTILSICISSSNMAILTTATEKENGTLETILTFPIKKGELITGKYLSSVVVGFIAALISLILMIGSFKIGSMHYEIFKDISLHITCASLVGCALMCLLASVFISGVAMFLTAFSKSYKEAQSKIGLINLVGTIPMFVSILNVEVSRLYYLIPICNYEQILQELLLSKTSAVNILIVLASTIVYTYIVVQSIIKLYNSEKILFNN